uniref:Uncharacterized protein n=1 Tax=Strigamia maritima TaxID=126957 RepID=T1JMQ0_STRMM
MSPGSILSSVVSDFKLGRIRTKFELVTGVVRALGLSLECLHSNLNLERRVTACSAFQLQVNNTRHFTGILVCSLYKIYRSIWKLAKSEAVENLYQDDLTKC